MIFCNLHCIYIQAWSHTKPYFWKQYRGTFGAPKIAVLLLGKHLTQNSIAKYIGDTHMDIDGAWGTDVETLILAHLFQTNIYVLDTSSDHWLLFRTYHLEHTLTVISSAKSMYLVHFPEHFEVVSSVTGEQVHWDRADVMHLWAVAEAWVSLCMTKLYTLWSGSFHLLDRPCYWTHGWSHDEDAEPWSVER